MTANHGRPLRNSLLHLSALVLLLGACSGDNNDPNNSNNTNNTNNTATNNSTGSAEDLGLEDVGSDMGTGNPSMCDPIAQNCVEPGSVCGLVVNTEGFVEVVEAFTCRESLGDVALGESCTRPNGKAGEDDCAPGLYCAFWGSPAGNPQERTCHQLCESNDDCGSTANCLGIGATGEVGACIESCDPRSDDCGAGTKCGRYHSSVTNGEVWFCDFDTEAAVGTSCAGSLACGAGQVCVDQQCQTFCAPDLACSDGGACAPHPNLGEWGTCKVVDWSCAGTAFPAPTAAESAVEVTVLRRDGFSEVDGATVSACAIDDLDCVTPITTGTTGANGQATLVVPTGTDGFDGYFQLEAAGYNTHLLHGQRPFGDATGQIVGIVSVLADTPWEGGVTVDDTRGLVVSLVEPCNPDEVTVEGIGGGAQVSVTSDAADGDTLTGYLSLMSVFDPALTATTINGYAALANHPAGIANLTYTNSEGTVVATRTAVVRANAETVVLVVPTP